jgi:hypothetical protein
VRPNLKARPHAKTMLEAAYRDVPIGDVGCWVPLRGRGHNCGYHAVNFRGKKYLQHRLCWEAVYGPIPDGMTIDHLCRNRACVRLSHLEPVTLKVNLARGASPTADNGRKTHCVRGHALSGDNLRIDRGKGGGAIRRCKACQARLKRASRGLTW